HDVCGRLPAPVRPLRLPRHGRAGRRDPGADSSLVASGAVRRLAGTRGRGSPRVPPVCVERRDAGSGSGSRPGPGFSPRSGLRRTIRAIRHRAQPRFGAHRPFQPYDAQRLPEMPTALLVQPPPRAGRGAALGGDGEVEVVDYKTGSGKPMRFAYEMYFGPDLHDVQLALYYLACKDGIDEDGNPLGFQPRFLSLWYPKDWVWGGMRQDIFSVGRP